MCVSSTALLLVFPSAWPCKMNGKGLHGHKARQISGHKRGRSRMSVSPAIPHCYYTSIKHRNVSNPSITKEDLQFGWLEEMRVEHSAIFTWHLSNRIRTSYKSIFHFPFNFEVVPSRSFDSKTRLRPQRRTLAFGPVQFSVEPPRQR